MPLSTADFTAREQAWIILSDMFVDTELTKSDLFYMARELYALGFDAPTAHHILNEEVAPVFGVNLLSVAGNWTGWQADDVVECVHAWLQKRDAVSLKGFWHRSWLASQLRALLLTRMVQADWLCVAHAMAWCPPVEHRVEHNTLHIRGVAQPLVYPWPIAQVLAFGGVMVIRLDPAPGACFNENVFAVGPDGTQLWAIEPRSHAYADSPYVDITAQDPNVLLSNWDGDECLVAAWTGRLL